MPTPAGDHSRGGRPALKRTRALSLERKCARPPVVEDEQIDADDLAQSSGIVPVGARQRQGLEQAGHTMGGDGEILPAGLLPERKGEPALADAARSSVILPGVRRLRFGFFIRFTRVAGRRSWRLA